MSTCSSAGGRLACMVRALPLALLLLVFAAGCPDKDARKFSKQGESCTRSADCEGELGCIDGKCVQANPPTKAPVPKRPVPNPAPVAAPTNRWDAKEKCMEACEAQLGGSGKCTGVCASCGVQCFKRFYPTACVQSCPKQPFEAYTNCSGDCWSQPLP